MLWCDVCAYNHEVNVATALYFSQVTFRTLQFSYNLPFEIYKSAVAIWENVFHKIIIIIIIIFFATANDTGVATISPRL